MTAVSVPCLLDFPTMMDFHLELGAMVDAFFSKTAERKLGQGGYYFCVDVACVGEQTQLL